MARRIVPAVLFFAAVAALAQDGQAPPATPGYTNPRVDFGIVVTDFDAALEFYTQVLGLKETREFTVPGEFGKMLGLSDGLAFTVHVMQLGDEPDATQVKLMQFDGTRPHRPDNSFLHSTYGVRYLTFYVDDLTAALKRAAEHDVTPIADGPQALPEDIAPGIGIAVIRDPDGNVIELVGKL